jgi:hypothetical protein
MEQLSKVVDQNDELNLSPWKLDSNGVAPEIQRIIKYFVNTVSPWLFGC